MSVRLIFMRLSRVLRLGAALRRGMLLWRPWGAVLRLEAMLLWRGMRLRANFPARRRIHPSGMLRQRPLDVRVLRSSGRLMSDVRRSGVMPRLLHCAMLFGRLPRRHMVLRANVLRASVLLASHRRTIHRTCRRTISMIWLPLHVIRGMLRNHWPIRLHRAMSRLPDKGLWLCRSRCGRISVIHGSKLPPIPAGRLSNLILRCGGANVTSSKGSGLTRGWPGVDPAVSSIEADPALVVMLDSPIVHMTHFPVVQMIDRAIVVERAVIPIAALITEPGVAESIVDAAIKPDLSAPIPRMP